MQSPFVKPLPAVTPSPAAFFQWPLAVGKSRKHVKYRNFAIIRRVFANARKKNGRATSLGPHAVSRCAPIAAADAPQAHTNHLRTRTSQALVKTARPHASQLLRKSTCANTNLAPENALRPTQPLQKRQNAREVPESSASTTCQSFRKADITHYLEIWALMAAIFGNLALLLIRFAQYASLKMPPGAFLSPKRPKARLRDT